MNTDLDWSDYAIVLQIADAGSLSGAAKATATSHPTMFRRINAIEEKLGTRLFDRFRTGYRLTAAGEEIVTAARTIADLTHATELRLAGRDLRPSGLVRIAITDSLLYGLLAPRLDVLRQLEPDIKLEFIVSNDISNLSHREADIALRPLSDPDQHLIGRNLGIINQAVYAHQSLVDDTAAMLNFDILPWIGPTPSMPYGQLRSWMSRSGYDGLCVCTVDSVVGMLGAAKAGAGLAVLPAYLGDPAASLIRVSPMLGDLATDLWLLTHPDLRLTARVRAMLGHIADLDLLKEQQDAIPRKALDR